MRRFIFVIFVIVLFFTDYLDGRIWNKRMRSIEKIKKWKVYKTFYASESVDLKKINNEKYVMFCFDSKNNNSMAKYKLKFKGVNLRGMKELKVTLNNFTDKKISIAFAFVTGSVWWELPVKEISKGENTLIYDLTDSIFATKDNGWINSLRIKGENDIRGWGVVIYPDDKMKGCIGIKNVSIDLKNQNK